MTTSNSGQFVDSSDNVVNGGDTNDSGIFTLFYKAGATATTTLITAYCEGAIASKTITIW